MNIDESRKSFEQWALEVMQFTPDDLTWDEARNCYRDYVPHMAWKGFQAGRESIEIEIPGRMVLIGFDEVDKQLSSINAGMAVVESAIRAAGIKVKE